jgi:DNA modification methylase
VIRPPALPRNQILVGDALTRISVLPDASVDCVITSPPYFRLRDYAADGQLGLEAHVDQWVD